VNVYGWSASGTVKTAAGVALPDVAVTVQDSATTLKATTNAAGAFTIGTTTGIVESARPQSFSAQVVGNELVLQCPLDGPIDLALVDASGRSVWSSRTDARQGTAKISLPTGLRSGAIFLRVRHSQGVQYLAVSTGTEGMRVARAASRSLAANPVLVFKLSGYDDTTYAMTSSSQTGIAVVMSKPTTCDLPTKFSWKDYGGPVASPKGNNWVAIKDFTGVTYNGKHYIYMSTHDASGYGSGAITPFTNWSDAASATQTKMNTGTVAPELMYFSPKSEWILSYQWCSAKFCYMTNSDASNANGWAGSKALLSENVTGSSSTGPIDQVVICDASNCYLFYADDNGHVYRASMAKSSFPGTFSGSSVILTDTQANLFEAVEVYTVKGQSKYLMIVECMGSGGRYFRAFTATSLGGTWTSISGANNEANPFAGKKNVTGGWSDDISHGDLVRSYDETRTVDPCNLQMMYQGYKSGTTVSNYGQTPYQLGLLTLQK